MEDICCSELSLNLTSCLINVVSFPGVETTSAASDELTVVQTLNFDLAEVQRGGHTDVERTFRDGVSSVTHGDGHVPLMETQAAVNSSPSVSSHIRNP